MRPERAFVAERRAAQHCSDLLRRAPASSDLLPRLARLGDRMARVLAPSLASLSGNEQPAVAVLPPREIGEGELADAIGPLSTNAVLSTGVPGVSLLLSLEGAALLRLIDRAFGGKGDALDALPESLPLSADLLAQRVEGLIAASVAAALGHADASASIVMRRDSRLSELAPWPAGSRLAMLQFEVSEAGRAPWRIAIALPLALLGKLLGNGDGSAPSTPRLPHAADPTAAPYANLPLPLSAMLVDMAVPLSALAGLDVGAVLPVTVARSVPLSVGDQIIALGSVGSQDDRIAIKITRLP